MDISYKTEDGKFNFRVAIVIKDGDRILLEQNKKNTYWNLIGGRVKFNENTKDAIKREVEEEIGYSIDLNKTKFNSICENFFTYNNLNFHEILFIYVINIDDELTKKNNFGSLDKKEINHRWFTLKEIEKLEIQPNNLLNIINDEKNHFIINS
jgi:8-oxo-dGTP pyrophosphatase MutT (NUDIX family)